ncbi:hypothetical protein SAMN02746065_101122 [Desulfocicer vacuolatum DSM 3385]|uniref:Uncharacterized protein n=1 Tax=Desulfocicer vacuolatum DSM 3385 TaxID=1121400 RepID=A0A1W1YJU6_9BACT|nr:hypothetical protein SAMN02746065_101122 [Desulfocicer vacuolatum DSM 3385]
MNVLPGAVRHRAVSFCLSPPPPAAQIHCVLGIFYTTSKIVFAFLSNFPREMDIFFCKV